MRLMLGARNYVRQTGLLPYSGGRAAPTGATYTRIDMREIHISTHAELIRVRVVEIRLNQIRRDTDHHNVSGF